MKCPICGKDLELKNKQIGTSENGEPIFNEYAICRDCRKQWNLDKQRAKKTAAGKTSSEKSASSKAASVKAASQKAAPAKAASQKAAPAKAASQKAAPAKAASQKTASASSNAAAAKKSENSEKPESTKKLTPPGKTANTKRQGGRKTSVSNTEGVSRPVSAKTTSRPAEESQAVSAKRKPVKKRVSRTSEETVEEKRYSNIPSEKVRTKHEKAARQGYEDMLATGTIPKPGRKKKQLKDETKSLRSASAEKPETSPAKNDDYEDYDDDYYDDTPKFRAMRIVLAVLSLAGFAYFIFRGFTAGLTGTEDSLLSPGMVYVILALCMLVSALLYFIMLGTNTVFAFLLPMIFYLGGGVFAFFNRGDDMQVLAAAVAGAVLAVISLILAITSRGGDEYDDDYDDAFDDDYADDYDD